METGNKIIFACNKAKLNQTEMGKAIGATPSDMTRLVKGRVKKSKWLKPIAEIAGLPLEWLAGDRPDLEPQGFKSEAPLAPTIHIESGPREMPVIGAVGAASDGHRGLLFDHPELKKLGEGLALFRAYGNSAYPVIYDGQFAIVSTIRPLRANNLAVIETPDGWMVKRWCPQPDGKTVVLSSPDSGRDSLSFALDDLGQRFPVIGTLFE